MADKLEGIKPILAERQAISTTTIAMVIGGMVLATIVIWMLMSPRPAVMDTNPNTSPMTPARP